MKFDFLSTDNNNKNNYNSQKNNSDILSLLNSSIQINVHNHPLRYCYAIERQNYGTGWTCNKCSKSYSYDTPSFYCTICDFDLCQKCLGEYR